MEDKYYILTFNTTSDSMKAETALHGKIAAKIIALPSEISSGCGFALKFSEDKYSEIIEIFGDKIKISGYYKAFRVNGIRKIEKLK